MFSYSRMITSVSVALALTSVMAVPVDRRADFTLQNGKDAIALNQKFAGLSASSSCTAGENACVGDAFAQCVGSSFVSMPCGSGLICAALPLVNSAGTSITCTTAADRDARIAATGATGGDAAPPAAPPTSAAPPPPETTAPAAPPASTAAAPPPATTTAASGGDNAASGSAAGGAKVPSPAFVVYTDRFIDANILPPATSVAGFNVINLSFLTLKGAFDQALAFANLPADQKASKKKEYADAGISIMVAAFGETDKPTTSGADPVGTANTMAQFVLDQGLDGIDVDYEDLDAVNKGDGAAEAWVTTFTKTLREKLPVGQFILSHAPLAPWMAPNAQFGAGAYVTVNKNVGDLIDFYNIQFYNQGLYTDCDGLINTAGAPFTGSALLQIPANGFDINKLVIGKPGGASDATNGFIDPATLGTCVAQAKAAGWNAGVMAFQFPNADAAWIKAAKGTAFA